MIRPGQCAAEYYSVRQPAMIAFAARRIAVASPQRRFDGSDEKVTLMLKKSSSNFLLRQLCSILSAAVCVASFGVSLPVLGQEYPTKPMRLIVPFPPGGGTDILARLVGQKLTGSMGQQVIVDNRPGAGGSLGAEIVAKSSPDGYVLVLVSASYAVNAGLYKLAFTA